MGAGVGVAADDVEAIVVRGAREHNLKNLTVSIPRGKLVVITGVSGSGKSTLAFDLIFAEGQRRFLDCMSAYARQFVEQMARPDVDLISGLPPTVSIEQRTSRGGGKSTVATVTEIQHFLRLLFARLGTTYCPDCRSPVQAQTRDGLGDHLLEETQRRGDLLLLAPLVKHRKGFHSEVAEWAARHGYAEVRADGKLHPTDQPLRLDRFREHDVEVVIGVLEKAAGRRTTGRARTKSDGPTPRQLIDEALSVGKGTVLALDDDGKVTVHSTERACPGCGRSFQVLDPKQFSYNSAQGWCPKCRGFGELFYLPDADRGARADAIEESWWSWQEGKREVCPECAGARLNPVARSVRLLAGLPTPRSKHAAKAPTMESLGRMSVAEACRWVDTLRMDEREGQIARDILPEIRSRLKVLDEIGLGYLQLGRSVTTLSGGEGQRIRLAAQLGSNLSGVLYVLDEPTIGLHARDNQQLLDALEQLRRRGNSLVVVEHDEDTMRRADHVIDLGPGAGVNGGQMVAAGTLAELQEHPASLTGRCLKELRRFPARGERRPVAVKKTRRSAAPEGEWLRLSGAALNNLRDLTVEFPLGRFVVVTGVSGSGKSTLIRECLLPALATALDKKRPIGGTKGKGPVVTGHEALKGVYEVDQSPIGRTPRSTPATYVGFFDEIRALFAQVPESRMRGYGAGRFSFNSAAGRCPQCDGAGETKLEMNFLPPAYVRCEVCKGTRFNPETLDIEYGGKNIAQVLGLSVEEGIEFFAALPRIRRPLEALRDTGLGYLQLGQTSPTLSGGEAQRVKLVTHLLTGLREPGEVPDRFRRRNLFLLEEPTIGLHMSDVHRLVEVIQRLVDHGHTVIVIEHNLDLVAEADWVIDLGPEAGEAGGQIVAQGTPEQVAAGAASHTGRFLAPILAKSARMAGVGRKAGKTAGGASV
ncbi:MAG: excinuclease ABC subunit A [Verrucomicrobiales bacterium]|nr:excinuclease ABC subunit A [Verrucomicrobiales bacterium]